MGLRDKAHGNEPLFKVLGSDSLKFTPACLYGEEISWS